MKLLLLIALSVMMFSCSSSDNPDKFSAQVEAESYVTELLKSPSTADFGINTLREVSDHEFTIDGYVDSQNSFGAIVRLNYSCTIVYSEDFRRRTIEDFEMNEL